MIEIQIMSTNIQYNDGAVSSVTVHFQGKDEEKQINLSGRIPLTAEEYNGNAELDALKEKIRSKLVDRLEVDAE